MEKVPARALVYVREKPENMYTVFYVQFLIHRGYWMVSIVTDCVPGNGEWTERYDMQRILHEAMEQANMTLEKYSVRLVL